MILYGITKKYIISLTDEQLKKHKSVIRKKQTPKTVRSRCQITIELDETHGKTLTHEQSAKSNDVCMATVTNTVKLYLNEGIKGITSLKRNVNSDQLRPHRNSCWCIPSKEDAEFVACMENVLDVYELPYDPMRPVVCMDEKPYQLLGEAREPLPMKPGNDRKIDPGYTHTRNGTCNIFAFVEPLGEAYHVSVHEHRTAANWAMEIKYLSDEMFPKADRIILVLDNLNTHKSASLYKVFPPAEARRIIKRLEIHYTPKHGSWLDIAEIKLNAMTANAYQGV